MKFPSKLKRTKLSKNNYKLKGVQINSFKITYTKLNTPNTKENAFKMRFEPLGQKMFTRRNWLLRCSILINIAVILYICSHVMIGNRYTLTTGSQFFIQDQQQQQQTQSQQQQQGMVREPLGKSVSSLV